LRRTLGAAELAGARPGAERNSMTKKLIIAEKPSVANDIARDRAHERAPGS